MSISLNPIASSKPEIYSQLNSQINGLLEDEHDFLANASNFCSLIYHSLPDLNWTGFYIYKEGELVLGPFQGKPACVRIPMGNGVCGTAARDMKTLRVENVHQFEGHIACDTESNSEIVIPIIKNNALFGVFDLDSPILSRFDQNDQNGLESLVQTFLDQTRLPCFK